MNNFLSEIILPARRGDDAGWMQLLIIVVVVVFYVLRNLAKAKSNKAEQEGEAGGKAGRTPLEGAKDLKKQAIEDLRRLAGFTQRKAGPRAQVQPPGRKTLRPQPIGQKVAAEAEQPADVAVLELLEESELRLAEPQAQPEMQEAPEFKRKAVEKLKDRRIAVPAETPEAKYLAETLLDYTDPDALRRAILHYEILGKPLSVRGPSEHIIGL